MGLESGTYISDLNSSNPVGATDSRAQGDDHIRLIKSTIKATFPNITGAVTLTHTQLNDAARKSAQNTFTDAQTISFSSGAKLSLIGTQTGLTSGTCLLLESGRPSITFQIPSSNYYMNIGLSAAGADPRFSIQVDNNASFSSPVEVLGLNLNTGDMTIVGDYF